MPQYRFYEAEEPKIAKTIYFHDTDIDPCFRITISVILSNRRSTVFKAELPIDERLRAEISKLQGFNNDTGRVGPWTNDKTSPWIRRVKQVIDLEDNLVKKAEQWIIEREPGSAQVSSSVVPILTGLRLADLTGHLKNVKYVWISSDNDPSSVAELIYTFSGEVGPGEKMYKLTPKEHTACFGKATESIFAIMNDEQMDKLGLVIQAYFRAKVSKALR